MMNTFSALLEARDPALGRFRSYRLDAGIDLFGAWVVEITFGRIGTTGRRLRYVAGDEPLHAALAVYEDHHSGDHGSPVLTVVQRRHRGGAGEAGRQYPQPHFRGQTGC